MEIFTAKSLGSPAADACDSWLYHYLVGQQQPCSISVTTHISFHIDVRYKNMVFKWLSTVSLTSTNGYWRGRY